MTYKHESRNLYLYYSPRADKNSWSYPSRWMIDSGGWYLNPSRRDVPQGFIYALSSASTPLSKMEWKSVYGDTPTVKIEKIEAGK